MKALLKQMAIPLIIFISYGPVAQQWQILREGAAATVARPVSDNGKGVPCNRKSGDGMLSPVMFCFGS